MLLTYKNTEEGRGKSPDSADEVEVRFIKLIAAERIDQIVINQVPVIMGSGRPFFATGSLTEPLRLENPIMIVQGDRVVHLVYDVSR